MAGNKNSGPPKGVSNNPKGKPKGTLSRKRQEWEEMGEMICGTWTEYVMMVGNDLIEEGNWEEFWPLYTQMLNYFKPRLASTQLKAEVKAEAEVKIKVIEPDWDNGTGDN